jgi:hypothetical protein
MKKQTLAIGILLVSLSTLAQQAPIEMHDPKNLNWPRAKWCEMRQAVVFEKMEGVT